jgi:DinB family protein
MPVDETTPMSVVLAEEIADANAELIGLIESCSEQEWKATCRGERWSVGVVAHHIAWGHERAAEWIRSIRDGIPIPGSAPAHNASNALKAIQVAGISRDEVIFLARRNGDQLIALLRSLDPEDLAKTVPFGPAGGRPLSIEGLGRSHLDRHLASMRATLRRDTQVARR